MTTPETLNAVRSPNIAPPRISSPSALPRPGFYPGSVNEYAPATFSNISAIKFTSVTGTVKVSFNGGGEITVSTGDTFQSPFPLLFERVVVTAASGGSATIVSGLGTFSGGGSGGLVGSGAPTGSAASGATYYDATGSAFYVYSGSAWVQLI